MKGVSLSTQKTMLWIIERLSDGQIYTINLDTKKCDKSKVLVPTFRCIPGREISRV